MKTWTPRSSSLAGYLYCQARAAYDRAYAVGDLVAEDTGPRDMKYADLGTIIHQELQQHLGCVFDTPPEPHSIETITSAAALFGGDATKLMPAVNSAVLAAAGSMPQAADGKPWRAEVRAKSRLLTGHIDFLSQDGTQLIDLKTTSRKPDHNRVKGEHFLQMLAYKFLVPSITSAHILYVDAVGARWAMLSPPMDFASPDLLAQVERLPAFLRRIRSKNIYASAIATPGGHCASGFCPHTAICKDRFIPGPGTIVDRVVTALPACTEVFQ